MVIRCSISLPISFPFLYPTDPQDPMYKILNTITINLPGCNFCPFGVPKQSECESESEHTRSVFSLSLFLFSAYSPNKQHELFNSPVSSVRTSIGSFNFNMIQAGTEFYILKYCGCIFIQIHFTDLFPINK